MAPRCRRWPTQVEQHERTLLGQLQDLLDVRNDVAAAAAAQVRALMFVARFRQDIEHRLEALEQ